MTEDTMKDSFYLHMLSLRNTADSVLCQFYSQLCRKLNYYNGTVLVTVDGKTQPLSSALMAPTLDPDIPSSSDSLFIFRGVYIKAFEDGSLLLRLIKDISTEMGQSLGDLDNAIQYFALENNARLRAFYWYIDKKFTSKLTPKYQISFNIDCMMFGAWQCNHRNVIGINMMALACLMGVEDYKVFLPPEVKKCFTASDPALKGFLKIPGMKIAVSIPSSNFDGKKVAKKGKKVAKDDRRGRRERRQKNN